MATIKDLTGQKFGRLTVVGCTEKRDGNSVIWECKCDCGTENVLVIERDLRKGYKKSCGCVQEMVGQRFGKLTVVRATDGRRHHAVVWECLCDCGETVFVAANRLLSGKEQSCGCLNEGTVSETCREGLTGMRFGKLTAVRPTERRRNRSVVWECVCECGNTTFVAEDKLRGGHKKSCGCHLDLTGQKFGRLTAVRPTEERKRGYIVWECKCDCGETVYVDTQKLRTGKNHSCGCAKREKAEDKRIDLAGMRFGKLTAVRPTEERRNGHVVWECVCDCGNAKGVKVSAERLLDERRWYNNTQSCGCVSRYSLIGQRFGKLTAIRPTEKRNSSQIVWECLCDCGNTKLVASSSLRKGEVSHCGCEKVKKAKEPKWAGFIGQRFGKLTILRRTEGRRNGSVVWECVCECGNTVFVTTSDLRKGVTQSCGCHLELTGKKFGLLTAVRPTEEELSANTVWECSCICGGTIFVKAKKLLDETRWHNNTQSCGCLRSERVSQRRRVDLTGQRFGRLVAIKPTEERKRGYIVWECVCDCGDVAFVDADKLRIMRSCGCLELSQGFANLNQPHSGDVPLRTWGVDDGSLTINGKGKMADYSVKLAAPWSDRAGDITSAVVEDGVTSVGAMSFYWCENLTSVALPKSLTSIGNMAFEWCGALESIELPNSIVEVGEWAFHRCSRLKSIEIPAATREIGKKAFLECESLTDIIVDAENQNYCSVYGVLYSKDMTKLIAYPQGKTAASFVVPDGVEAIEEMAFAGNKSLESVSLPDGLTAIGGWAFRNCERLKTVTLPNSVSTVGTRAFEWFVKVVKK